jgi:hypothetical protein
MPGKIGFVLGKVWKKMLGTRVFVFGKIFQPSLIFKGNAK